MRSAQRSVNCRAPVVGVVGATGDRYPARPPAVHRHGAWNRMIRPGVFIVLAAAVLSGACSGSNGQAEPPCHDPLTGDCVACPGSTACLHPKTCQPVACKGSDVSFGAVDAAAKPDAADATDATAPADSVSDGAKEVASPPDADAAGDSAAADAFDSVDAKAAADAADVPVAPDVSDVPDLADGGCTDKCPALNYVECLAGIAATRTCLLGADKCLIWSTPVACGPGDACEAGQCKPPAPVCNPACGNGKVCQGGSCVDKPCAPACGSGQTCTDGQCVTPATGSLTCNQVAGCIGQCTTGDDACKSGCTTKGTAQAQQQLGTLTNCLKAVCKAAADAGKASEAMFCAYSYCAAEQTACFGSGAGTCAELNACSNDCGSSATCSSACNAAASTAGAQGFWGLMACVDEKCAGQGGDAQVQCAQTQCKTAFDKCFPGGGTGGSLSCKGILACAEKCATKDCAQTCKAQGSDQGKQQLEAVLACQSNKCGTFCDQGGPACDKCFAEWCGNEWAACK